MGISFIEDSYVGFIQEVYLFIYKCSPAVVELMT